jgi:probable phosphoglycerate mutase
VEPPELFIVRHGVSEWNELGRWQGHADPPLSPRGNLQAQGLVERLGAEEIQRIEASDLLRARTTAAPLADALGLAVHVDEIYRELDVGLWSGLPREEVEGRRDPSLDAFLSGVPDAAPPEGESRRQLWRRAQRALEDLSVRCPGERVAVFTHGGFVRACFPAEEVDNASVHRGRADEILRRLEAGPPG